jgi:hypothetical protein
VTSQPETTAKKPYQKPDLRLYGDIQTITGQSGMKGVVTDAMTGALKSM